MSDLPAPKTWKDAAPTIVWGALVFTCFFVFIEKLVEQTYGQALAAFILGLGIAAVALHSKTWLEQTNPNWAYGGALALVLALVLSPFVEEKQWPFSAWFKTKEITVTVHDKPTQEEIEAAAQAKIDEATRDLRRQLEDRDKIISALKTNFRPPTYSEFPTPLSEVQNKIVLKVGPEYFFALMKGKSLDEKEDILKPYVGKWIHVAAVFDKIETNISGDLKGVDAHLQDDHSLNSLYMEFDRKYNDEITLFKDGEYFHALCKIESLYVGTLNIKECDIERK